MQVCNRQTQRRWSLSTSLTRTTRPGRLAEYTALKKRWGLAPATQDAIPQQLAVLKKFIPTLPSDPFALVIFNAYFKRPKFRVLPCASMCQVSAALSVIPVHCSATTC
ncbi:hypothetical protein HaLaN_29371 [Haematococcus lacustris]|uniref:Uncharacterized protein n=1 Tax=Haematococcus lacustris TaxID=44745 RepID=A0A6A0ACB2_HAELA|nr:hypothetical protein HaLaN_29371 [Haematococcus lacustris]